MEQTTSANDRRQQPRPALISHGVCVLTVRHQRWPMVGGINQSLDESDVACAHLVSGISQWQATAANAGPHHPWPAHIGQPTSCVACPYLPRPAHSGVSRSSTWPAHIAFGLHTMISRCRTWAATISCG
ncbi:hypothetical protein H5410_014712 [Solanum commersonii]|uniref:Uncharacterized protein n=1 Tax=Solanum commersonii TaxID=4109 RepID=A0A9J5ZRT0_SOLCO|nr:hypothetical protein H5410_014712 [Solanum commersonii]